MRIEQAGENALIVYFTDQPSPAVSDQIAQVARQLRLLLGPALLDLVPSYGSLLVLYDPLQTDHLAVRQQLRQLDDQPIAAHSPPTRLVRLPVWYDAPSTPDMAVLAQRAGLSKAEAIALHSDREYRVYAIGFARGFAYLGEVAEQLAAPRLATPRLKVPQGAVAIADRQTAVYPAVSPGGWNLIGLCPVTLFDLHKDPPMPVTVGDRVCFYPIDQQEYLNLGGVL